MELPPTDALGRTRVPHGRDDSEIRLPVGTHATILPKSGCLLSAYAGSHVVVLEQFPVKSGTRHPVVKVRFVHPIDPRGSGEDNCLELEEFRLEVYTLGEGAPKPGRDYDLTFPEQMEAMMAGREPAY